MVVVALVINDTQFKLVGGINESEVVLKNEAGDFATYMVAKSCPDVILDGIGYKFMRPASLQDRWYSGADSTFGLN